MQVTVKDVNSVKKTLQVEVPVEDVVKKLDSSYATLKKNAKVKGFRPGKAPRSVLERLYKSDVEADVSQELVSDSFREAIRETGLKIVAPPEITPPALTKDAPYSYEATVEIFPEIQDLDLTGIELTKTMYKASDQEVDQQVEMIRKNLATLKPVEEDRPAQNGDFVMIDYKELDQKDQSSEPELVENFTMEIGKGNILPQFDDQVAGMKKDEKKDFEISFPEDYKDEKFSGKKIIFNVKLKEIREQILPEIDDEFAKDLGEYKTFEDLKNSIKKHLQEGYDKRADQELDEQIYQALLEKIQFEVPETLVDHEVAGLISESEKALTYRNMTFEDTGSTREEMAERYREPAEKQVRRYLLLDKIIEQEKLTLPDSKLETALANMAQSIRQPLDVVKKYYESDAEQMGMLKHTLLQKEAVEYAKGLNKIKEVEPKPEEQEEEK